MRNAGVVIGLLAILPVAIADEPAGIAQPRPLDLVGLHAYAEKIVTAGETIHFRVSSTVPYVLSVCRLGRDVDDPASDEVLATFPESPPIRQPIHPGSFAQVDKGLPGGERLESLTVECWVRPWRLNTWQTLMSQYDYPTACGFGLFIGPQGRLHFYLGDGQDYRESWDSIGPPLEQHRWHHVVGTWDGDTKSLWLDGKLTNQWKHDGRACLPEVPLRLGGCGYNGPVTNILDGDLAAPAIYGHALTQKEVVRRFDGRGLELPHGEDLLACWPLCEERGNRIRDVSGCDRHGHIVNVATWMIGGPSFDARQVPRYQDYDPVEDATRGHGIRFASDDYYDCGWDVSHTYKLPKSIRPGLYVGRFQFEMDSVPRCYHVTFVVKRSPDLPKAPVLVIASTNSWLAYMATPFAVTPPGLLYHWSTTGISNSPGNPPAYCMYRNHQGGQPAYQVGVNRPWPNAGPYVLYASGGSGYSHLMRAERFALAWLEENGFQYDMVGDLDVHRNPRILSDYPVVLINGHGEYWSRAAYRGLDQYLSTGGNLIVLSGNVMVWRVSFNDDETVMECRKFDVVWVDARGAQSVNFGTARTVSAGV